MTYICVFWCLVVVELVIAGTYDWICMALITSLFWGGGEGGGKGCEFDLVVVHLYSSINLLLYETFLYNWKYPKCLTNNMATFLFKTFLVRTYKISIHSSLCALTHYYNFQHGVSLGYLLLLLIAFIVKCLWG